jgi:hypothetical protein
VVSYLGSCGGALVFRGSRLETQADGSSSRSFEEDAETLGIDLATATEKDGWALSAFYGARPADKRRSTEAQTRNRPLHYGGGVSGRSRLDGDEPPRPPKTGHSLRTQNAARGAYPRAVLS